VISLSSPKSNYITLVVGSDETKLDEVTMLLAIAVFVLHTPAEVVCAPNLQYPCINQFKQCLQSNNITVSRLFIQPKLMKWTVQSLIGNTHIVCSKYRL
jgi:hypothetical protein